AGTEAIRAPGGRAANRAGKKGRGGGPPAVAGQLVGDLLPRAAERDRVRDRHAEGAIEVGGESAPRRDPVPQRARDLKQGEPAGAAGAGPAGQGVAPIAPPAGRRPPAPPDARPPP